MHRKITRQSRWNLSRASDKAIPNQAPGIWGEGVETGWRAPHVGEGTVRLSSKGESDRITQRSVVQIHPRNHQRHCLSDSGVLLFSGVMSSYAVITKTLHRTRPGADHTARFVRRPGGSSANCRRHFPRKKTSGGFTSCRAKSTDAIK